MIITKVTIKGKPPGMLTHNVDGGFVSSPARAELQRLNSLGTKQKKEPANIARVQRLEWELGFYRTPDGRPALPSRVIRGAIHNAAKLSRDGQRVNRGIQVQPDVVFHYQHEPETITQLAKRPEYVHESVVVVQRNKILRVRPIFREWSAEFRVLHDPEMANEESLREWILKAGRFIGVGDWRIDKGGEFGGFDLVSMETES